MAPIAYDLFHEKLALIKGKKDQSAADAAQQWVCEYSKRVFKTEAQYRHYLTTSAYKRAQEKHAFKQQQGSSNSAKGGKGAAGNGKGAAGKKQTPEDDDAEDDEEGEDGEGAAGAVAKASQPKVLAKKRQGDEEEEEEEGEGAAGQEGKKGEDDEAEEEEGAGFGTPIPLKSSLFSSAGPFKSVKASLDHMYLKHGFYLPFVDFLVDLEGLLEFLGAKVGFGHVCLFCNKQFGSTRAVQGHMRDKAHCNVSLTDKEGKEDEELLQFWHFGQSALDDEDEDEDAGEEGKAGEEEGQGEEVDEDGEPIVRLTAEQRRLLRERQRAHTLELLGKEVPAEVLAYLAGDKTALAAAAAAAAAGKGEGGAADASSPEAAAAAGADGSSRALTLLSQPVRGARSLKGINDQGELVMSDGAVIGHRDHKRFYDQKIKPETNLQRVQRSLASSYYAIGGPGSAGSLELREKEKQNHQVAQKYILRQLHIGVANNMLIKRWFRHANPK